MAPSCHLKGSGKCLSRAQACPCLQMLPLSASVTTKGLFQPQMFLLLPQTQDKLITVGRDVPGGWASGSAVQKEAL